MTHSPLFKGLGIYRGDKIPSGPSAGYPPEKLKGLCQPKAGAFSLSNVLSLRYSEVATQVGGLSPDVYVPALHRAAKQIIARVRETFRNYGPVGKAELTAAATDAILKFKPSDWQPISHFRKALQGDLPNAAESMMSNGGWHRLDTGEWDNKFGGDQPWHALKQYLYFNELGDLEEADFHAPAPRHGPTYPSGRRSTRPSPLGRSAARTTRPPSLSASVSPPFSAAVLPNSTPYAPTPT